MEDNRFVTGERGSVVMPGENEANSDPIYFVDDGVDRTEPMQDSPANGQVQVSDVLDEQSIQQLVDSGTVTEDSIIAIVQNENGEPQTVVLTRQEAESLGIQLSETVEQNEGGDSVIDGHSSSPLDFINEAVPPIDEAVPRIDEAVPPINEAAPPAKENGSEDHVGEVSELSSEKQSDDRISIVPSVEPKDPLACNEDEMQTTTVSLDSVTREGDETATNDVLSNIIQSLFNPNEPNQSNVSIVPRMVGGKRKLCLRLPASTASALLAQTGSPLATSFQEGGVPKKIKIVIPPSSGASASTTTITTTEQKVIKVSMLGSRGTSIKAPQEGETSSVAKSSKPFLASLFSSNARYIKSNFLHSFSTVLIVMFSVHDGAHDSVPNAVAKKPLGSTENPIQLVQEGNNFRSLQPLTPDQLKHIASVLKQNRQVKT